MTLPINPPPLQVPSRLNQDRETGGFFDALLRTLYQLWAEVRGQEFFARTTTADATNTALQRVSIPEGRTVFIDAAIVARRTGGSAGSAGDSAAYVRKAAFKNISGTVSLVGSVDTTYTAEDQAGWNCGYAISGTEAVLTATGAANNAITWNSFLKYYEVGV